MEREREREKYLRRLSCSSLPTLTLTEVLDKNRNNQSLLSPVEIPDPQIP